MKISRFVELCKYIGLIRVQFSPFLSYKMSMAVSPQIHVVLLAGDLVLQGSRILIQRVMKGDLLLIVIFVDEPMYKSSEALLFPKESRRSVVLFPKKYEARSSLVCSCTIVF